MNVTPQLANDVHFLTAPLRFVFSLVRAAIFLAIFPLLILGLCFHAALIGGPIMDDDMWLLTKVLSCVLAPFALALIAGIFSKGSLIGAWAKEFLVLILSFVVVAGFLRFGIITFNDSGHAPAIWMNHEYDYADVYKGGSAFKIGSMENGKFEPSYEEIQHMRKDCFDNGDTYRMASCAKSFDCIEEQCCAGRLEDAALRSDASEGRIMDFVHVFILTTLALDKKDDVRSRNIAATFDLFEAEDHRNKGVENDYEAFVVPCDWRDDAEQSKLIASMREFRAMVEQMQVESLR